MKLIVGLGNPDTHYAGTRHNIGFAAIEAWAQTHDISWQNKDKFKARVAEGYVGTQKVIAAQPSTYYNLSGDAVQAIAHFYKIAPADILIVHDELALPFGTVRTRIGGSDAGNNGLKSVIATISSDFARVRVGIANEHSSLQNAADFVLGHLNHEEQQKMPDINKHVTHQIDTFISEDFSHTTVTS